MVKRTLETGSNFYGKTWRENIELARSESTAREIRMKIPDEDISTKIALLWGATNLRDKDYFETLANKYRKTSDWGTLASIVCSPLCNQEVLHDIGTGIAKENGYGYILRIVGRNKNTGEKTLKEIAEDPKLDKRYTEVARTALEEGNQGANNLI